MSRFAVRAFAVFLLLALLPACQPAPINPKNPQMELVKAAAIGDAVTLRWLLNAGVDPNFSSTFRGWTPLILAAAGGHGQAVQLLVASGAQVNARASEDGVTALMRAARAGDAATCLFLLERGAEIDARDSELGASALMHAAFAGREEALRVLLQSGADVNQRDRDGVTPLWLATTAGPDVVRLLLEHGADPNIGSRYGVTPLMEASGRGEVENIEALIAAGAIVHRKDVNGKAAINHALNAKEKTNRHSEAVRLLKAHGADTNGKNRQIDEDLLEAALRGRLQEARKLLAQGADVNARDSLGFTVLMKASGRPQTSIDLIEQGADPFALNRGKASVLHDAAASGNMVLVQRLLELGAAVDALNHNNETPLNRATQTGHVRVVKLLLEHSADPNIRSRFGTPLMLAIERDNQSMIALLREWGAK